MDVSAPATPLIMDPFGTKTQEANAFEFDFIGGGNFFNTTEEDDLLSSLYNKNQPQTTNTDILFDNENTFTSLSHIVNEKSLPDSPDSWVSNSSNSDNECEDLELCEFTSESNVQRTTKATSTSKTKQQQQVQQPPVMSGIPTSLYPYPQGMMDPYLGGMMPMPMMSPQQLMFLQQQQQAFSTFNAMGYANFVPAPVPQKQTVGKKSTSPTTAVMKQERSSPKTAAHPTKKNTTNNNNNIMPTNNNNNSSINNNNLKRRRDVSPPKEEMPTTVIVEDTHSNHSSPTSSPSSSPTPKPEKDVKRQRRLIKNRESAQASRERKKVYVQGLEKRVDDLAQTNNLLNTKVLTLEEENNLLREKLLSMDTDGSLMKELNEPNLKKRRIGAQQQPKIPIPSLQQQQQSVNPFANGFWNAFMSFAPPHAQNTNASAWNTGTQSKKVVLFVMLFCVAVLVMSSKKGEEGNLPVTSTFKENRVTVNVPNMERRSIGRGLKTVEDMSVFHDIAEQFLQMQQNATMMAADMDVSGEEEEEKASASSPDYHLEYSKDKNSLVLTFPLSVVKREPGNSQCATSPNQQMEDLTKKLLSTLCKELN